MCAEIAIAEYTLTPSVLVKVVGVLRAVLGVLGISERVGGVVAGRVPLRLYILL